MDIEMKWEGSLTLDAITKILEIAPMPEAGSEIAQFCSELIAQHLISLIMVCSDANLSGRHSVAVSLLRNMEDALDCFGAVSLIPDAAEKWLNGNLKASDAAKLYEHLTDEITLITGEKASEYRKTLRKFFNKYAHCTYSLTQWDIYPDIDVSYIEELASGSTNGNIPATLRVNHAKNILMQNGIRIGAFLAAHTLEFSFLVEKAYHGFLDSRKDIKDILQNSVAALDREMKQHGAVYLDEIPPEIKNPIFAHPENPDLAIQVSLGDERD